MSFGMRSANYRTLDSYTAPSGGVTKGDLVKIEDTVGFYYATAAVGEIVAVVTQCDIVELAKKAASSGEAIAQGAKVYYEAASGKLTATAGSNTLCGRCRKAATSLATTVEVSFNGEAQA